LSAPVLFVVKEVKYLRSVQF